MTDEPAYATGGLVSEDLLSVMGEEGRCWRWIGPDVSTALSQFKREFGAAYLIMEATMWGDPLTPERARELAEQALTEPPTPTL